MLLPLWGQTSPYFFTCIVPTHPIVLNQSIISLIHSTVDKTLSWAPMLPHPHNGIMSILVCVFHVLHISFSGIYT